MAEANFKIDAAVAEMSPELREQCEGMRRAAAQSEAWSKAPRAWLEMMHEWICMVLGLCSITGAAIPDFIDEIKRTDPLVFGPLAPGLWLRAWRWMWTLQAGSEARKAAFTLGEAAFWFERWRTATESTVERPKDETAEFRAEAALRILRWHVDDAKQEASVAQHWGFKPTPGQHGRVYEGRFELDKVNVTIAGADGKLETRLEDVPAGQQAPVGVPHRVARVDGELLARCEGVTWGDDDWESARLGWAILEDHFQHRGADVARLWPSRVGGPLPPAAAAACSLGAAFFQRFTELCIASLPAAQPWAMTTDDVTRFLELILEET